MILKVCSICGTVYHKDGMCPKCNIPLGEYTTQELVDELCKRDGVEEISIPIGKHLKMIRSGEATILVVKK